MTEEDEGPMLVCGDLTYRLSAFVYVACLRSDASDLNVGLYQQDWPLKSIENFGERGCFLPDAAP